MASKSNGFSWYSVILAFVPGALLFLAFCAFCVLSWPLVPDDGF